MSHKKIVSLCLQRGEIAACWDNEGEYTPIFVSIAYDENGESIPFDIDNASLGYIDLTGAELLTVNVEDVTVGPCPISTCGGGEGTAQITLEPTECDALIGSGFSISKPVKQVKSVKSIKAKRIA